jgi:preprotein translocase subunit SecB
MDTQKNKSVLEFTKPFLVQSLFTDNHKNDDKQGEITLSLKTKHSNIVKDDEGNCSAKVLLTVSNMFSGKEDDDEVSSTDDAYNILVTMEASFRWPNKIDESLVNDFLTMNAPSLLLSYVRPIVSSLTAQSRFNPEDIPFMNFVDAQNNN